MFIYFNFRFSQHDQILVILFMKLIFKSVVPFNGKVRNLLGLFTSINIIIEIPLYISYLGARKSFIICCYDYYEMMIYFRSTFIPKDS